MKFMIAAGLVLALAFPSSATWSQEFEAGQVDAPTLGGSFQEGILDCEITERSLVTFAKYDRARNVGFRLRQTTASGR